MDWKLVTNLPVSSAVEVAEELCWHPLRWKIEVYREVAAANIRRSG